jgi:hypothetical protein
MVDVDKRAGTTCSSSHIPSLVKKEMYLGCGPMPMHW